MRSFLRFVCVCGVSVALVVFSTKEVLASGKDDSKVLRVYTARHYPADLEIYDAFKTTHGITVESVLVKNSAQLVERVLAESSNPQADLVITTDVGQIMHLAEKGAFAPLESTLIADAVPRTLRDERTDLWAAFALRARVIAYRKGVVNPKEISNIETLSDEKWRGRLLVRPSSHIYNQSLAAALLAAHGPESFRLWAKGISQNLARKPQGGDVDQIRAIASGEGDVAIVNSYYMGRLLASSDEKEKALISNVGILYPNQDGRGAHVNGSAVGIVKGTNNIASARLFAEFLLNQKSQEALTFVSKEFPVLASVKPDPILGDSKSIKLDLNGIKSLYSNTPQAVSILNEVGWR